MNRLFRKLIIRVWKAFYWIGAIMLMTGCAAAPVTPATSSSIPAATASSTPTPVNTAGVSETMPPLATSLPPKTAFILGDCQPAIPPAGPAGAPNASDGGSGPAVPSDPVQDLQDTLQLANQEMEAAAQSTSLEDARSHAEAVVNSLVGYWGCWYGDGDGNGVVNDPSNGYGVLPAGRVQSAAPDTRAAQLQLGLALSVYETSNANAQNQVRIILGDVEQWQNNPIAAYEQIQMIVQNSDASRPQVSKLDGQAIQALAWARLILVKAQTVQESRAFAENGLQNLTTALQAGS